MNFKIFKIIAGTLILLLFFPFFGRQEELGFYSISEIFKALAKKLFEWLGYLAALGIGVAVLLIASSGGDPIRLNAGKRALVYVAIGYLIFGIGYNFVFTTARIVDFWAGVVIILEKIGLVAGVIGVMFVGYGIFKIATSGGDPKVFSEGKMSILYGGIGAILGMILATDVTRKIIEPLKRGAKSAANLVLDILGTIAAVVGTVFIAYGIFKIATSGGDPKGVEEGKRLIIWGGIGIILGLFLTTGVDQIITRFGLPLRW